MLSAADSNFAVRGNFVCVYIHRRMTSIYCESGYRRPVPTSIRPRTSFNQVRDSDTVKREGATVISGLKSIFCSKTQNSSSRPYSCASTTASPSPSTASYSGTSTAYSTTFYRREVPRVKTSDSFPVLSAQLEERMLQLADRSRRLGVHRYSRSRNALVLNQRFAHVSSSGSVQKVCLVDRLVSARE
jgi:hypothetical protein